ncbi:MAG: hypothetical protein Q9208_003162 [Pyrenodesmia sp. 3 TL-2023]
MLHELSANLRSRGIETIPIDPHASGFSDCQSLTNKFFLRVFSPSSNPQTNPSALIRYSAQTQNSRFTRSFPRPAGPKHGIEMHMPALWKELDIDLIVCPVGPHAVPPPERWNAIGYTSFFVLLDYPAGVVQVGVVGEGEMDGEVK